MSSNLEIHKIEHLQLGYSLTASGIEDIVDEHIADLNIHYIQSDIDHGTVSGLEDNDHPQYLLIEDIVDIDHGTISGLLDDDHSQYLLLAGRTGGQIVTGGTASGDDLTLYSTSHATKGSINIGTDLSEVTIINHQFPAGGDNIEINALGTGNRLAFIDFHGDDTYTDYGLRIIRTSAGANAPSSIAHRGTGEFSFSAPEGANWYFSGGTVGIGTTAPHAGVGWAKFAIDGAGTTSGGAHLQFTTTSDDYPLLQILNYTHDNISLFFDSFYDGSFKSSDAGSNFCIRKTGDLFSIQYDSGIAVGSVLTWNTAGFIMNTSGNVGIGVNPAYRLDVVTSSVTNVASFFNDGNSASYGGIIIQAGTDDGSGTVLFLQANDGDGTATGYLRSVEGVFALIDVSDARVKENITDTRIDGLDIIKNIPVKAFSYKKQKLNAANHSAGFIAQDLQQIFPEAVTEIDGILGVSKDTLIPVLVKAVQELTEQNNELLKRIEQLELKLKKHDSVI